MPTIQEIIARYYMRPLVPEGGYIAEVYQSDVLLAKDALPRAYTEDKPAGSAILYLITQDSYSKLHKLPTDEIYHFYLGDPVEHLQLYADGSGDSMRMGQNILQGEQVQLLAPAGCWQGSRLVAGGAYALLGTTMAPAYTKSDYAHGHAEDLIKQYPQFTEAIKRFT